MWSTGSFVADLITAFVTILVTLLGFSQWSYLYWKRRNLPYLEPRFPLGNISTKRQHAGITVKDMYDTMKKRGWKHGGIYAVFSPVYMVVDLDYVKNILSKDFQHFTDHGVYHNERGDPLTAHLFNLGGTKWRNLRTKLTPTFTSGKMRMMFQTVLDCEVQLQKKIELDYEKRAPINIKEVLQCFTMDVIGSCAFGLELNNFVDENSPFRVFGRKILERTWFQQLKLGLVSNFPNVSRALNISVIPKELSSFFMRIAEDMVEYREENNVVRKDFMQLLIDMKNDKVGKEDGHDGRNLTMNEIAAQSFVFFLAGFETSSTTMAFALYELARNQDIQDKLRDEINSVLVKYENKITYEAVQEMKYMHQVIDETLRMYPLLVFLPRKCTKEYRVPDTDVIIEKDTLVVIPVLGIHHDEEYYPQPEKFDPERFTEENKQMRHSFSHIPFGEGPRICLGIRFAFMQSKIGLTSLLRNHKFTVNEKTKEPLKMKMNVLGPVAEGGIWLNAHRL